MLPRWCLTRQTPEKFRKRTVLCDYHCVHRVGCSADGLGEDDPVGWFELEEEWDEADVKLQRCRVAKVSIREPWPPRAPTASSDSVHVHGAARARQPHASSGSRSVVTVTLTEPVVQWETQA